MSTPTPTRGGSTRQSWTEGLGEPVEVPRGSFRQRLRSNPATHQLWRVLVFVVGLLLVVLGVALAVLPGPLTIPPVLAGLWVWSTEFAWAKRFFESFKTKAREAWQHAKAHPVSSTVITVGGLAMAGVAFWAVNHFDLVDRLKDAVGA